MIDASKEAARASVERIFRDERGRVLAALVGVFRDFQIAEDALHDLFLKLVQNPQLDLDVTILFDFAHQKYPFVGAYL